MIKTTWVPVLFLVLAGTAACGAAGSADAAADAVRVRGEAYLNQGKHDLAIHAFDSAIALRPNDHLAFRSRGAAHRAKDEIDRAIQDFDRAIELKPDFASAINSRGFAYQLKGDYERASRDFDRAIELAPANPAAYRNRANTRFILGRFADAATDLERSVKVHADSVAAQPGKRFNETGGYAVVWLHLARMRAGQDDATEFTANAARVDSVSWPRPVIAFFQGKLTADQLVAGTAAEADPRLRNDQRCGAEFFAGQAAMWKQQSSEARKRFETVVSTCSKRFTEHAVAVAELSRPGASSK
jgi:lipoprotein NlpI